MLVEDAVLKKNGFEKSDRLTSKLVRQCYVFQIFYLNYLGLLYFTLHNIHYPSLKYIFTLHIQSPN